MCFETKKIYKIEISVLPLKAHNWGFTAELLTFLSHVQQESSLHISLNMKQWQNFLHESIQRKYTKGEKFILSHHRCLR